MAGNGVGVGQFATCRVVPAGMVSPKPMDVHLIEAAKRGHKVIMVNHFHVECWRPDGTLDWVQDIHNVVADEGFKLLLNAMFNGSTATTSWYVGLVNNTPTPDFTDNTDTMALESYTEYTGYASPATRQAWASEAATGSGGSIQVQNASTTADFTMGAVTIGGVFVTTGSTKGGSTGTLWAGAEFSPAQTVGAGSELRVTYTVTLS